MDDRTIISGMQFNGYARNDELTIASISDSVIVTVIQGATYTLKQWLHKQRLKDLCAVLAWKPSVIHLYTRPWCNFSNFFSVVFIINLFFVLHDVHLVLILFVYQLGLFILTCEVYFTTEGSRTCTNNINISTMNFFWSLILRLFIVMGVLWAGFYGLARLRNDLVAYVSSGKC